MFTATPTRNQLSAVICLGLALVTAGLYWPMLHHDFIGYYDDAAYITENSHVTAGLTGPGITWAFQSGDAANWHPLTWISHLLDCQLYGLNPRGHHLTNLLFHVANTLLLFLWLSRLTGAAWRSALVAALFAWHPVHVESVAWAAERKDVLSAFFWMLTLIAYTRYVTGDNWRVARTDPASSPAARHPSLYYFLALCFFACGLMSKPMVVTLPFVLLLLDFWPLNRFQPFFSKRTAAGLIIEKVPFFALALAGSVITYSVQQSGGAFWSSNVLSLHLRVENALMVYVRYISKIFWPADLALIYPYPHRWPAMMVAGAALLLALSSVFCLWRARRNPYLFTGWCWFLGTLVPTLGLVQVGVQSMADRYLYLPGIGLFILVAWGMNDLVNFRPHWRKPVVLVCSTALAGCLIVTGIQLSYWQNSLTIFLHTVKVTTDNYSAYTLLGNVLENSGRKEDALSLYREAVRVQPDFPSGQFSLGMLLLESGRPEEASNHLAIAAQLMPHNPEVQYDLGLFRQQHGDPAGAIGCFKSALAARPEFPEAKKELGEILAAHPDLR
jgi:hypothetical protein